MSITVGWYPFRSASSDHTALLRGHFIRHFLSCPTFSLSLTFGFGTSPLSFFLPPSSASSGLVKLLEWITEFGTLILFIAVSLTSGRDAEAFVSVPCSAGLAVWRRRGGGGSKKVRTSNRVTLPKCIIVSDFCVVIEIERVHDIVTLSKPSIKPSLLACSLDSKARFGLSVDSRKSNHYF